MMMLISFMPWFLFWILALQARIESAAIVGFLTAVAIVIKNRRQGRSIKSLQIGTLVFFVLLGISVSIFGKEILAHNIDLIGNSAILIIVFVTIVIGRPFSLEFMRERVEKRFWGDRGFLRANYFISWLWFTTLLVNLSLVAARHFSLIEIARWVSVLIRILDCIVAMKVSIWYMHRKEFSGLKG